MSIVKKRERETSKTFTDGLEEQVQIEELRKASYELNKVFNFRGGSNTNSGGGLGGFGNGFGGGGNGNGFGGSAPVLTTNSSTVEVQEWLNITLPEFKDRESVLNACSHLNGAALLSPLITEQEMKDRLGMKPFGIRRKLILVLMVLVRLSAVVKDHNQIEEGGH